MMSFYFDMKFSVSRHKFTFKFCCCGKNPQEDEKGSFQLCFGSAGEVFPSSHPL